MLHFVHLGVSNQGLLVSGRIETQRTLSEVHDGPHVDLVVAQCASSVVSDLVLVRLVLAPIGVPLRLLSPGGNLLP